MSFVTWKSYELLVFATKSHSRFELGTGHSIPETVQYLSANGRERTRGKERDSGNKLNSFASRTSPFDSVNSSVVVVVLVVVFVARNSQPLCLRYPVNRYERILDTKAEYVQK